MSIWVPVGLVGLIAAGIAVRALAAWWRDGRERLKRTQDEAAAAAAQCLACNRCRTGSTAWACTCTTDCYAAPCTGWWADVERNLLRGGS